MAFGDGRLIREYVDAFFGWLAGHLSGTDGEGGVFLIWGGLVVIGFVLISILFRILVLGDAAPLSNRPIRRARVLTQLREPPTDNKPEGIPKEEKTAFKLGHLAGKRGSARTLDEALESLYQAGVGEPRILASGPRHKHVRVHRVVWGNPQGCEYVRGYLQGSFERLLRSHVTSRADRRGKGDGMAVDVVLRYGGAKE